MKVKGTILDDYSIRLDLSTIKQLKKVAVSGMDIVGNLSIENGRSLPQHKRYFGVLGKKVASFPESTLRLFYANLVDDFTAVGSIDPEMIHELLKKIYGLSTIKFAKLSQAEANKFFKFADEKLNIWGGIK